MLEEINDVEMTNRISARIEYEVEKEGMLFRSADTLVNLQNQLNDQAKKLDDYMAAQKSKQDQDDAKRVHDLKKQRRHEWCIALVSAAIGAIFSLLVDNFQPVIIFIRDFFH